jgi:hypothetical protein
MTRRKGELSPDGIDREWPHQAASAADQVTGPNYEIVNGFCSACSYADAMQFFHSAWHFDRCPKSSRKH